MKNLFTFSNQVVMFNNKLPESMRSGELTTEMGLVRWSWWSFVQGKAIMNKGSQGNNLPRVKHKVRV